jgi:hypothetical protein
MAKARPSNLFFADLGPFFCYVEKLHIFSTKTNLVYNCTYFFSKGIKRTNFFPAWQILLFKNQFFSIVRHEMQIFLQIWPAIKKDWPTLSYIIIFTDLNYSCYRTWEHSRLKSQRGYILIQDPRVSLLCNLCVCTNRASKV